MTDGFRLTFRILALAALGIAGFTVLTRWSAPGHDQAAMLVGLLLTLFGVMVAKSAMTAVVLVLAGLRMLRRVLQGRKPMVFGARGPDPLDRLGRVLFVAGFTLLSALVGAGAGLAEGGQGIVASAAAFAAFGALLAIAVPDAVMFATDENTGGTISDAQRAEHAAARAAGEPTMLLADRVVKGLREGLFEDPRKP